MKSFDEENCCEDCEFFDECDVAGETEFCENCKDHVVCPCTSLCMAGYAIACNNGFTPRGDYLEGDDDKDEFFCQEYEKDEECEGDGFSVNYCEFCEFRWECNMVDHVSFCEYCKKYLDCSSQALCIAGYEIGERRTK